eukprot:Skav232013  [mRNA]  locus=scaffold3320:41607:42347:+ [translate_table: standard]
MPPMIVICIWETRLAQYGPTRIPMKRKPLICGRIPLDHTGKWLPMAREELNQKGNNGITKVSQDIDLSACKYFFMEGVA